MIDDVKLWFALSWGIGYLVFVLLWRDRYLRSAERSQGGISCDEGDGYEI